MERYIFDENNGLWYELVGDYYLPMVTVQQMDAEKIGIWGERRRRFLREHMKVTYNGMLLTGNHNIIDIDQDTLHIVSTLGVNVVQHTANGRTVRTNCQNTINFIQVGSQTIAELGKLAVRFLHYYSNNKLISQKTDWYQYIHMDDFEDYYEFGDRFLGADGKPRYSQEDYEGFRQCADEWYVLDGGKGEFSTNAPLGEPVRIKLKKPKYY